jgi:hypothetical protein
LNGTNALAQSRAEGKCILKQFSAEPSQLTSRPSPIRLDPLDEFQFSNMRKPDAMLD